MIRPAARPVLPAAIALAAFLVLPARARLVDAIHNYTGEDESTLPQKLSQTGLYDNVASKSRAVTAGIVAFEVNSALWSDGSAKQRWVTLPVGTAKITPTDSDAYVFPAKTVMVKNFAIDTVHGDSLTRILIETRFLVHHEDPAAPGQRKWTGMSYKWRRDQADAELVSQSSGLDTAHLVKLNGRVVGKRWRYPSRNDCSDCHRNPGRGSLGFITQQLHRPSKANAAVNQLEALFTAGILSANIANKAGLHKWSGLKDAGATTEAKARSFLASNCSHCHGNGQSLEGADHSFDWFKAARKFKVGEDPLGYVGKPTGKEPGYSQVVYAGYPESSFVMFRMLSRGDLGFFGFTAMPPLATFQPDSAAVTVMRDWICSLGPRTGPCKAPEVQKDDTYWEQIVTGVKPHGVRARTALGRPVLRGGMLVLPEAVAGVPRLYDQRGREIRLTRVDGRRWAVEGGVGPGVYLLRAGARTVKVHLLP